MGYLQGEINLETAVRGLIGMPIQSQFFAATEPNAAMVGGKGAAKTFTLMVTCIANCLQEPNGLSLVGRLNFPALEQSTMRTFLELVEPDMGEWAESKRVWTFKNGHQVIFRHLDITDPKIVGHVRSLNLSAAYIDEASEVSEEVYFLVIGQLRRKGSRRIFRMTANPAGHDWMWRHFFDPERSDKIKVSNRGIVVSMLDNPYLDSGFIDNVMNTYPDDWKQRFVYGSFADFSDLIYKEFSEKTHCWNPLVEHGVFMGERNPPSNWPVIVGIDIGSDIDPWAVMPMSVSPTGSLYVYDELYGNSMLIADIADRMHSFLDDRKVSGIAYDYSNRQCAIELAEHKIWGQPAIKEVEPGLFKTSQYFHIDPRLTHPFDPRIKGAPRIFISRKCKNVIRELGGYKWARNRSGTQLSEPAHPDSHSPDALRYAIHTFRPLPEKTKEVERWENPTLDITSKLYWREQDRRDQMEKFKPRGAMRTMREWNEEAARPPARFQKFTNYSRRGVWPKISKPDSKPSNPS